MPIGDVEEHLHKLAVKMAKVRGLPEPEKERGLRIYHADFTDPEIENRMGIISAKDDIEALAKAIAICTEAEGIVLDELNEIDSEGVSRKIDIVQQVDKQSRELLHDPPAVSTDVEVKPETKTKTGAEAEKPIAKEPPQTKPKKPFRGDAR